MLISSKSIPVRVTAVVLAVGGLTTACGSNGSGATSATSPGAAGAPADGGTRGSGGSDAAGNGSSGAAAATEVFNPELPPPSHDCRTDTAAMRCISVSGSLGGEAIDRYCTQPSPQPTLAFAPPNIPYWPTSCAEGETSATGYFFQVAVPAQVPGTFDHQIAADDNFTGADVVVMLDGRGADFRSDHLLGGEIAGWVEEDPTTGQDIVAGTFRATWGPPDGSCIALIPDICDEADVHGTFRGVQYLDWQE